MTAQRPLRSALLVCLLCGPVLTACVSGASEPPDPPRQRAGAVIPLTAAGPVAPSLPVLPEAAEVAPIAPGAPAPAPPDPMTAPPVPGAAVPPVAATSAHEPKATGDDDRAAQATRRPPRRPGPAPDVAPSRRPGTKPAAVPPAPRKTPFVSAGHVCDQLALHGLFAPNSDTYRWCLAQPQAR